MTSTSSAPESSASQETTWHSEGFHVQLLLLCPGGSPAGNKINMFNTIKNLLKVLMTAEPSLTWVSGLMRCYQRSIWLCCSICRPGFRPPGQSGCSGPPMIPPCQQLQVTQHTHASMEQRYFASIQPQLTDSLSNMPEVSFVMSSLNCAFAVSKSKSDSNCKVVALEFFTRS